MLCIGYVSIYTHMHLQVRGMLFEIRMLESEESCIHVRVCMYHDIIHTCMCMYTSWHHPCVYVYVYIMTSYIHVCLSSHSRTLSSPVCRSCRQIWTHCSCNRRFVCIHTLVEASSRCQQCRPLACATCMCVRIHINAHVYTLIWDMYVRLQVVLNMSLCTRIQIRMCCTWVYVHVYRYVCVAHVFMYTKTDTYMLHMCLCARIQICICLHT
jgi:hypothetical protein